MNEEARSLTTAVMEAHDDFDKAKVQNERMGRETEARADEQRTESDIKNDDKVGGNP